MIEIKLVAVNFSVQPLMSENPDEKSEDKQINLFHAPTQTAYLAPFSKDATEALVADLTLSNEELLDKIEKRRTAQELEIAQSVPGQGLDLSKIRG